MNLAMRVSIITGLSLRKSEKVIEEVFSALDLTVEEYVRQRHLELSKEYKNKENFRIIQKEVSTLRFKIKPLSLRQIKRIIYG